MAALAAPARPMSPTTLWARAGWSLVSLATALAILGATMLPFFTPAWIDFEQSRSGAAALTGYAPADVQAATDSIVHDLLFGGDFAVRVAGNQVLDPAEISHMRDVRGVFGGFAIAAIVSVAGLGLVAWRTRRRSRGAVEWAERATSRLAAREAVARGASWLAVLLVVLGVLAVVAFDAAFQLFHEILFPGGNFNFDPRTEKLVQLFPEQFWSETALAYGALAILVSIGVAWLGRRGVADGSGASR